MDHWLLRRHCACWTQLCKAVMMSVVKDSKFINYTLLQNLTYITSFTMAKNGKGIDF